MYILEWSGVDRYGLPCILLLNQLHDGCLTGEQDLAFSLQAAIALHQLAIISYIKEI